VPQPAKAYLVAPKFPPAVQALPSYSSVAFVPAPIKPPNPKPAV
jgi:hypothetical protein